MSSTAQGTTLSCVTQLPVPLYPRSSYSCCFPCKVKTVHEGSWGKEHMLGRRGDFWISCYIVIRPDNYLLSIHRSSAPYQQRSLGTTHNLEESFSLKGLRSWMLIEMQFGITQGIANWTRDHIPVFSRGCFSHIPLQHSHFHFSFYSKHMETSTVFLIV